MKMKKLISLFLVLAMMFSLSATAFAVEAHMIAPKPETDVDLDAAELLLEIGDTKITGLVNEIGELVLIQYVNSRLDRIDKIAPENPKIITCQQFDQNTGKLLYTGTVDASDFIEVTDAVDAVTPYAVPSGYETLGYITYRYDFMMDTYTSTQTVSYKVSPAGTDFYKVDGYVGSVVDLAGIVAGAFITEQIASVATLAAMGSFLLSVVVASGVAVVGGIIKEALTVTVGCDKFVYDWHLYCPEEGETILKNVGYKYVVTVNDPYVGDVYTEGITTFEWGTDAMSSRFYHAQYPASTWSVLQWVRYRSAALSAA